MLVDEAEICLFHAFSIKNLESLLITLVNTTLDL